MELGSEYNLDMHSLSISKHSFFQDMGDLNYCLFDSGRNALRAITGDLKNGSVLMPEYICESVLKCFSAEKIIFYRLKDNLQIDADDLLNKIDGNTAVVYLMHYFGSLQPANVLSLLRAEKEKYGFTVIEDTTHSIFSRKYTVGDYCVASLRKWFAVPNGGVLYSANPSHRCSYGEIQRSTDNDKAYAMMLKTLYLNGRLDCNLEYRKFFIEWEEKLGRQRKMKRISDYSEFLLGCYDVPDMVKKRRSNFYRLKNKLSRIGIKPICDFTENDCPFTFPVMVPERDKFRKYLMKNQIYCAVHWPFDGRARGERPLASALSDHMISLPIDQRYGEKEMTYLSEIINAYKGRLRL